jgi:hypothetical protein
VTRGALLGRGFGRGNVGSRGIGGHGMLCGLWYMCLCGWGRLRLWCGGVGPGMWAVWGWIMGGGYSGGEGTLYRLKCLHYITFQSVMPLAGESMFT